MGPYNYDETVDHLLVELRVQDPCVLVIKDDKS